MGAPKKLSPDQLGIVLSAIEDTSSSLSTVSGRLWDTKTGLPRSARFGTGTTLTAVLQDNLLPSPAQRLVAIFLLYDLIVTEETSSSRSSNVPLLPMIESPFTIVLVELVEKRSGVLSEQLFLTHLMSSTHSNSASLAVPDQIAQSSAESLWGALEKALRAGGPVPKLNLSQLRRSWAERHPPPATSVGDIPPVSAIVIDPEPFLGLGDRNMRLHEELGDDVELHDFVPSFVRPIPPLLPISADSTELRWIDPEPLHEVLWDPAMGATGARGGEVAELMATALRSPLQEEQQQRVKAALDADPRLVFQCGLSPENLPDLVQNNSIVATEVLVRLLKSNQKDAYFDALVNMDMNQHSMAVVNRLTSTVQLPPAFVQTYVSNCIRSCGNIPDRFGQVRMVRFVCVFLQSLIKNNLIDLQDLFIEVQAFCMEHSRIREAGALFRLLKSQDVQKQMLANAPRDG